MPTENDLSVTWVWTPSDCQALHVETDPTSVSLFYCPDGVTAEDMGITTEDDE